jgi:hypothetical protein
MAQCKVDFDIQGQPHKEHLWSTGRHNQMKLRPFPQERRDIFSYQQVTNYLLDSLVGPTTRKCDNHQRQQQKPYFSTICGKFRHNFYNNFKIGIQRSNMSSDATDDYEG